MAMRFGVRGWAARRNRTPSLDDPFILRGNRAQHICGQVQPVEKNRDVRLFAVRIFEDGEQDFFAGLVREGF